LVGDKRPIRFWVGHKVQYLRFAKDREAGAASAALLDRYNSHRPMVDIYRKRVDYWNPLPDRYELSKDQILAVLDIH